MRLPLDGYYPTAEPPIQDVMQAIAARYQFTGGPSSPQIGPAANNTYAFQNGAFFYENNRVRIHTFSVESIGAYVDSSSTDISKSFVNDISNFLEETYGFRFANVEKKISFISVLIARFSKPIDFLLGPSEKLQSIILSTINQSESLYMRKIELASGDMSMNNSTMQVEIVEKSAFVIERRVGYPIAENVYFCTAPMQTSDHIDTLEKIEKIR